MENLEMALIEWLEYEISFNDVIYDEVDGYNIDLISDCDN